MKNEQIPIIKLARNGFKINFENEIFNFTILFKAIKAIKKATVWQHTDAIEAPYIFNSGILSKIKFKISLIITPIPRDIVGMKTFPKPWRAPFAVCISNEKTIETDAICNNRAPLLALGYSKLRMGWAKRQKPTVQGRPINIEISIEKDEVFFAVSIFFLAIAADIVGIRAVENAILKDRGKAIKVSILPLENIIANLEEENLTALPIA